MARSPILTSLGKVQPTHQGMGYVDVGGVSPAAFGGAIAEGLGQLGDAMVTTSIAHQGPVDAIAVQSHQLTLSELNDKTRSDMASQAGQPGYLENIKKQFIANEEIARKQTEEKFTLSGRARNAMTVDALQARGSYEGSALVHNDAARQTLVGVTAEENLDKARASSIETGDMEELRKQTSFALIAAKPTLQPDQYAAFEAAQKQKNGGALLAHLDRIQETALHPGATEEEVESVLAQGQAEMQAGVARGWIDPGKGAALLDQWEINFKTRSYHALTPEEQADHITHEQPTRAAEGMGEFGFGAQAAMAGFQKSRVAGVPGLDQMHAAILAGNIQRESGFNTGSKGDLKEPGGASYGSLQWRESRKEALFAFAEQQHKDWRDPEVQMDYLINEGELTGTAQDRAAWARFKAATTPEAANAALKGFIRYGDNSQAERLQNAKDILAGADPQGRSTGGSPRLTGIYSDLAADRQQQMIAQTQTDLAQLDTQRRSELTRIQGQNNDAFQYAIAQMTQGGPAVIPAQVTDGVDQGLINPGQGAALINKLNEVNGFTKDVQEAVGMFRAGSEFNILDPDAKKKGNMAFDYLSKGTPTEGVTGLVDDFVRQGLFPDKVRYALEQGWASQDPAALAQTMKMSEGYALSARDVLGKTDWGTELLKKSAVAGRMAEIYGTDAATKRMAGWNDPERKIDQASLEPRLKEQLKLVDFKAVLAVPGFDTSSWLGAGTPSVANAQFMDQATADMKMIYEQEFYAQHGGDPTQGGKDILVRAQTQFEQIYGLTYIGTGHGVVVGKGELTKYPAEKTYPKIESSLGGDGFNYIRENVAQHVLDTNGTLDGVTKMGLLPINENALTAGDWAYQRTAAAKPASGPVMVPTTYPRYKIQFTKTDAYGHSVVDEVPGFWMMTDEEIHQSNDYQVQQMNRVTARARGEARAAGSRKVEQRYQETREQLQNIIPEPPAPAPGVPEPARVPEAPVDETKVNPMQPSGIGPY